MYGDVWLKVDKKWYDDCLSVVIVTHDNFKKWLLQHSVNSALEIGCGDGKYAEYFNNYTGIDMSPSAIEMCKNANNSNNSKFILGDFLKIDAGKHDLVFSHAVIDHIYNIDAFLLKARECSLKYVYISAYNGYWPMLKKHIQRYHKEGYYMNKLSVKKIEELGFTVNEEDNGYYLTKKSSIILWTRE